MYALLVERGYFSLRGYQSAWSTRKKRQKRKPNESEPKMNPVCLHLKYNIERDLSIMSQNRKALYEQYSLLTLLLHTPCLVLLLSIILLKIYKHLLLLKVDKD